MVDWIRAKFEHLVVDSGFCLDVDLQLPIQGISVVFGRSGSGKTTLLRAIAGLDKTNMGELKFGNEVWQSADQFKPVHLRQIGYIFQEASLLPHLTAMQNLAFAQKRALGKPNVSFDEIIELVGVENLLGQYPHQLSGGEAQRIALARALLSHPKLLLMDEPLAALDDERKQQILPLLEKLQRQFNIPIVYVTHSMTEVARLADHLVILHDGKVAAQGSLAATLPRLDLPVKFGDDMGVVIEAQIAEQDVKWQLARATFSGGDLWVANQGETIGQTIRLRILARDVSLSASKNTDNNSILNGILAKVTAIEPDSHPAMRMVQLAVEDRLILARITAKSAHLLSLKIGEPIWANVKSVSVIR